MEQHVYIFRNPFTQDNHITTYVVTADEVSPIEIHQQIKANQVKVNMNTCDCIHLDRYCEEHYNDWKTRYEEVRLDDEVLLRFGPASRNDPARSEKRCRDD